MSAEQRSTLIATYPSRRDAEMAKDRLAQEEIRALVTADDAGGMHPEMQLAHSVKLQVMENQAEDALRILKSANMLAEAHDPPEEYDTAASTMWRDLGIALIVMGGAAFAVGLVTASATVLWVGGIISVLGIAVWLLQLRT